MNNNKIVISPFKMRDLTPEKSKIVQETLFKNGYKWCSGNNRVLNTDRPILFFYEGKDNIPDLSFGSDTTNFSTNPYLPELTFEEFKRLYVKENGTYKVGDWILRTWVDGSKEIDLFQIVSINSTTYTHTKNIYYRNGNLIDCQGSDKAPIKDSRWVDRLATPEEISKAKGEFVLPEQWCVEVTDANRDILSKWRFEETCAPKNKIQVGYFTGISNKFTKQGREHGAKIEGIFYNEITFDQFKRYVLKEDVKEEVMNKDELLEEAKRRYPVGTKIRYNNNIYSIEGIPYIHNNCIICNSNANGKSLLEIYTPELGWAEIIQDTLKVEDLVEGEIYYLKETQGDSYIFTDSDTFEYCKYIFINQDDFCIEGDFSTDCGIELLRVATQEEKQWLEACILANKFIPKEEALKSKEMQPKIGKWYLLKALHLKDKWYIKLTKESPNYYIGEYCHTEYNKEGCFDKSLNYSFVELTDLPKIQQYLPDGHVDKLPITEWWKTLKKGDVVRFVKDTFKAGKFRIGKEYTITDITSSKYTFAGEENACYSIEEFELVRRANEVEKWNVGTYVVFTTNNSCSNNKQQGQVERLEKSFYSKENDCFYFSYRDGFANNSQDPTIKWFATLEEAEEFSKSLKSGIHPIVVEENEISTIPDRVYNRVETITIEPELEALIPIRTINKIKI